MEPSEFSLLAPGARAQLVLKKGRHLADREVKDYQVSLYYFDHFYVEIWRLSRLEEIVEVTAFTQVVCLEPYLETIPLPVSGHHS